MDMWQEADLRFAVGILKGAIEGDATAHFGSLLEWKRHLAFAASLGVVTATADGEAIPTQAGRDLYATYRLDRLPAGRAYMWPSTDELKAVLAELDR